MFEFIIKADEFRALASVAVTAAKDDTAPILAGMQITADEAGTITATATDRYAVARAEAAALDVTTAGEATLPAAEVLAFARKLPKRTDAPVTIKADEDGWTITHGGSAISGPYVYGNFPAVARLFPDKVTPVPLTAINPQFVARLAKILTAAKIPATTPWQMAGTGTSESGHAGPIVFYSQVEASRGNEPIRLWMMIQPLLVSRTFKKTTMPMPGGKVAELDN